MTNGFSNACVRRFNVIVPEAETEREAIARDSLAEHVDTDILKLFLPIFYGTQAAIEISDGTLSSGANAVQADWFG